MDTFIVRLFVPADADAGADELRGVVDHVGSGSSATFQTAQELSALMRATRGTERPLAHGDVGGAGEPV